MHALVQKLQLSVEDYLEGELESRIKHEYLAGEVVAMAGASDRHGLVAMALGAQLYPHARKRGCQLFMADMKVKVVDDGDTYFYYPDLVLACDPNDRESPYYRTNPCLIIEITSPSTARIDLFEKRFNYARIPGLKEYLVINPDRRRVEIFRYPAATHELYLYGRFYLACLDMELEVESLFADLSETP